ncbi:MAG: hypothetical protein HWE10_01715 [Gammaproteobacteria bacterium]|nr:hypothetical protein [Gammaproteobacteria bacterium]
MNLDEMKKTWLQESDDSASAIKINQTLLTEMKINKQMQQLSNIKWARMLESLVFFGCVILLGQYLAQDFATSAPKISALILIVFAIIGMAGNIGQVVLISRIDFSQPIGQLQKTMYQVCGHKLLLTKLLLMSTPFYLAYVFIGFDVLLGVDLFVHLEQHMIWFYSTTSMLLLALTAWFSLKLHYKNININWVKRTIQLIVGERLVTIAQFINHIESDEENRVKGK